MTEKRILEISWASLWRILLFGLFAVIIFLGKDILLGLFLALVISSGLEFIINFIERRGVPRTISVILLFLTSALITLIIVYFIVPFVVSDLNDIFAASGKTSFGLWIGPILSLKTTASAQIFFNQLTSNLFSGNSSPIGAISDLLGSFALAFAVIISSFYLSLSRDGVERFIKAVFPVSHEAEALRIYDRSRKKIGYWFRSQVLLSFAMGLVVWLSMFLLGVKHAFLIGIFASIFELVPFVGPILSGAIAVLFALATSSTLALYVLIIFVVIHQLESHFLVPLVTNRTVGLHPVIVIISLLIGIETAGVLGALISVPAAAVLQEVFEERSLRKSSGVPIP